MKMVRKVVSCCMALVLCMTTLFTGTVVYATESNAGDMARDSVVYSSESELFAAMRAIYKEQHKDVYKFEVTNELLAQVCYFDTIYNQYMFDARSMFYFNGDQNNIPANEGDYLEQNYYGSTSTCVMGNTIEIDARGAKYCTTLAQETAFESKLASLFASGGALSHVKNLSASEKVVACMDYIRANVKGETSYAPLRHTAYSALCEGTATCQGFSLLLYRMLREVGITNRILMGTDAAAHTYNIVLIDGKYYYCDPSAYVILKGSNSFSPAQLQEHYQTDAFKNNILSRISASDYPVKTTTETPPANTGNNNTETNSGNADAGASNNGNDNTNTNTNTNTNNNKPNDNQASSENTNPESNAEVVEYEILDGADSTYNTYQPSDEGLFLRAAGEIEKFVSVEVDGQIVDSKHYTVKEGSTIIIFTKEFMATLAEGEHIVKFNFTDGFANAKITVAVEEVATETVTEEIAEEETEESTELISEEKDKDNGSMTWIWVVIIIVIVVAVAAGVVFYMKKKQENGGTEESKVAE